jgi:transposase
MSRYRLYPSPDQEVILGDHCAHARFVWNLAVEQQSWWRPGRTSMPGYAEQCRQLTVARADHAWLRVGSQMVQQQALRDIAQASTDLARRFDVIRVENLKIGNMTRSARGTTEAPGRKVTQKSGLNRAILRSGWGLLVSRLEDKAPGRVEKIDAAFTSQRCSACGHIAAESRKSQALFACVACSYTLNADVNAARNIAAGHAVTARGRPGFPGRLNREPQLALLPA